MVHFCGLNPEMYHDHDSDDDTEVEIKLGRPSRCKVQKYQ